MELWLILLVAVIAFALYWLLRAPPAARPIERARPGHSTFTKRYVPMQAADMAAARRLGGGRGSSGLTMAEWREKRCYATARGEMVRSRAEVRIANYLFKRGISYEYEPEICGYRPDFFLPDHGVVIEYWGMDETSYHERRRHKTAAYLRRGYGLISLAPGKDVPLERDLGRQLYYRLQGQ